MMKQAIRAVGFAIYILWIVIIVFTATLVYSATQLGIDISKKASPSTSGGMMTLSIPFSLTNKGFYDIADLNITTIVKESNLALLSNSSTLVPLISSGSKVDETHKITINLGTMSNASLSRLLFNDTNLDIDFSLALSYARVIPLKISTSLKNFAWGAPLFNLVIGHVTFDTTRMMAIVPVSFENHSFFNLDGNIRIEIVTTTINTKTISIKVSSQTSYRANVEVPVSAVSGVLKEVRLYFDFPPVFSYGPKVIPIG